MAFSDASAVTAVSPHHYRARVPDSWQQGRGAFGGLVLGTLLRAIEADQPGRPTRTLAGDLCGPVEPGDADIRVVELRRGNNQTNVAATLTQRDVVLATATGVLSVPRAVAAPPFTPAAPPPSSWRDLPVMARDLAAVPRFAQHYDYRPLTAPFARSEPTIEGFIREREPLGRLDAPAMIGRLDAWWPTLFALDGQPRPVATISFVAEILVDPATLPADEPLRYRARLAALHDGFFVELRELWHGERVVALNQQTFAILR